MRVQAPPDFVFQLVASGGRVVERRSEHERLVEFTADIGGRSIVTMELVTLDPPTRIGYRWITGPLPAVEETIDVVPIDEDSCDLVYAGRFRTPHGGLRAIAERRAIRRTFARVVHEHLLDAKRLAEERAERSKRWTRREPQTPPPAG